MAEGADQQLVVAGGPGGGGHTARGWLSVWSSLGMFQSMVSGLSETQTNMSKSMASIDGRFTTHVDMSDEVGVTAVGWRSRTGKQCNPGRRVKLAVLAEGGDWMAQSRQLLSSLWG